MARAKMRKTSDNNAIERRRLFNAFRDAFMTMLLGNLILFLLFLFLNLVLNFTYPMPRLLSWISGALSILVLAESIRAGRMSYGKSLREHRAQNHLCLTCGYDLNANESGVCPECGKPALRWPE